MLHHYVFLKYKSGTTDAHIQVFCKKMLALQSSIKEVQHIEIGLDELHDERSWDLILIMQFASFVDLRIYQHHPEHIAAIEFNRLHVANVGSLDFNKGE
ncbi:MAG: hypothetical protein ACI92E_000506 [Oceanicoccus sp.]|jgi:hypothetical protein